MLTTIEKGTHVQCWWHYKLERPLWKTEWRFLKNKIELPHDTIIQTWIYISQRNEITMSKRYLHYHVHCNIIHNSLNTKTTYLAMCGDRKYYVCIYTHMGVLFNYKEKTLPPVTWINLAGIMLSEINQLVKDKWSRILSYM